MSGDRDYRLRWRSPERVRERHERMVELACQEPKLSLKEIAFIMWQEFGNPETQKPMDHSTLWHHLQGKCREHVRADS